MHEFHLNSNWKVAWASTMMRFKLTSVRGHYSNLASVTVTITGPAMRWWRARWLGSIANVGPV